MSDIPSISLLKVTCYGTQIVKKGQRSHFDDFQSFKEFQLHINKNRPSQTAKVYNTAIFTQVLKLVLQFLHYMIEKDLLTLSSTQR